MPLREDSHRYREFNGVQILATLRSLAINALRLEGIWSITEGIAAMAHDIKGLLTLLGWREDAGRGAVRVTSKSLRKKRLNGCVLPTRELIAL